MGVGNRQPAQDPPEIFDLVDQVFPGMFKRICDCGPGEYLEGALPSLDHKTRPTMACVEICYRFSEFRFNDQDVLLKLSLGMTHKNNGWFYNSYQFRCQPINKNSILDAYFSIDLDQTSGNHVHLQGNKKLISLSEIEPVLKLASLPGVFFELVEQFIDTKEIPLRTRIS